MPVRGTDKVFDGIGSDTIFARDGAKDIVDCGAGTYTVDFDPGLDQLAANCETP